MKFSTFQVIRRHLPLGVAALLLPLGCGREYLPPPVPGVSGRSATDHGHLVLGHDLHQAKCAACHPFVDPSGYSERDLRDRILPVMASKAGLSPAGRQAVLDYLLTVRKL